MVEMLALSNQKFKKKTIINMLRVLMEKADNMQQMDNISGEMEILRKNFKVMLKIKNVITEMSSAFDELSRT